MDINTISSLLRLFSGKSNVDELLPLINSATLKNVPRGTFFNSYL